MWTLRLCKGQIVTPRLLIRNRFHTSRRALLGGNFNQFGVDLLPLNLQRVLFKGVKPRPPGNVDDALSELRKFGLGAKEDQSAVPLPPNIGDLLPPIVNNNVSDHFHSIASEQAAPYTDLLYDLLSSSTPSIPEENSWNIRPGWTRYEPDGSQTEVEYPLEKCLVFDVEVCVTADPRAVMAVAVTESAWYSWLSPSLVSGTNFPSISPSTMVPLGSDHQYRLVIGHNVSYDRIRCGEEYRIQGSNTRFLDTMSLHIAVGGMTSSQRMLKMATKGMTKEELKEKPRWLANTSMNGLADVHQLYCKSEPALDKDPRDSFVKLSMSELSSDIPALLSYCAKDVLATLQVSRVLIPRYTDHFPHPATLAGMLTMSTAFLPTSSCWESFIGEADKAYDRLETEMMDKTLEEARNALLQIMDYSYKKDPWLWDMDWKLASKKTIKGRLIKQLQENEDCEIGKLFQDVGYPGWYQDLAAVDDAGHPYLNLSPSKRVVPKLLRLTWKGYPLHHHKVEKWGYLIPTVNAEDILEMIDNGDIETDFPLREILSVINKNPSSDDNKKFSQEDAFLEDIAEFKPAKSQTVKTDEVGIDIGLPGVRFCGLPHKNGAKFRVGNPLSKDFLSSSGEGGNLASMKPTLAEQLLKLNINLAYWRSSRGRIREQIKVNFDPKNLPAEVKDSPEYSSIDGVGAIIPGMVVAGTITRRAVEKTWLTASNAKQNRIGSELKSYIRAPPGYHLVGADVDSQELWLASVLGDAELGGHGVTALGWMCLQGDKSKGTDLHSKTASAAQVTRDQAKILNYGRIYGAGEPFAKLLLMQFNPSLSEIEAGRRAAHMYKQTKGSRSYKLNSKGVWLYNLLIRGERVTYDTVLEKTVMFKLGKLMAIVNMLVSETWNEGGKYIHKLSEEGVEIYSDLDPSVDNNDDLDIDDGLLQNLVEHLQTVRGSVFRTTKCDYDTRESLVQQVVWSEGSESHTFNKLEQIAMSNFPVTPVLRARITKALDSRLIGRSYLTSRINWVVQSSAVDYLHLLLVAIEWLFHQFDVRGRFVISIHDEIRYLVVSEDRYKAALALHLANLLVRAEVCARLKLDNLPANVAFFSSVDVDKVMRKEPSENCVTPSNPLGLMEGHDIPPGEGLDIFQVLERLKEQHRETKDS